MLHGPMQLNGALGGPLDPEESMERNWTWFMVMGNSELDHHQDRMKALGFAWAERRCKNTHSRRSAGQSHIGEWPEKSLSPVPSGSSPPHKTLSKKQEKGVEGSSWWKVPTMRQKYSWACLWHIPSNSPKAGDQTALI